MHNRFTELLRANADDRRALYATTAARLNTRAENVEKDLYVCWILDFLFNRRPLDDTVRLYFKGGTSLSKAYGLIQRFSEDIDIGIYKSDIGAPNEADIAALPSNNQRQKALEGEVDAAAIDYISGQLKDELAAEIEKTEAEIGASGHFGLRFGFDLNKNVEVRDVLIVTYKSDFDTGDGYVEPAVRIESGARPDPVPAEPRTVTPYVADDLPGPDTYSVPNIVTVMPERTFWEKALILHAMTETTETRTGARNPAKPVPDLNRYSRHYYDVHQIWTAEGYGKATASMADLAEAARQHKELMFRAPDHHYERAVPGSYRFVPTEEMLDKLGRDYRRMSAMIFGVPPAFNAVMASIIAFESFVNRR